jgi:hypothetical protein
LRPATFTRRTNILAGKSTTNDIDSREICRPNCPNIVEPFHIGPMFRKHLPTKRVNFNLPNGVTNTGTLKP